MKMGVKRESIPAMNKKKKGKQKPIANILQVNGPAWPRGTLTGYVFGCKPQYCINHK